MRVLFLGDIVGRPGRRAAGRTVRALRARVGVDFVIANCENATGGKGVDPDAAEELYEAGVDVLTSGNHVWQHRAIVPHMEHDARLIRPLNFPPGVPGRGWTVQRGGDGTPIAVINLIGRAFMAPVDCPFRAVNEVLQAIHGQAVVVIVDMHGEATSEKVAMGRFLDGRVSAVVGSHTHVQTADAHVLPGGTAYITDAGMCGPEDSVLGVRTDQVLRRFLTQMPRRFEVATENVQLHGAIFEIDEETGRALSARRIQKKL